MLYRSIVRSSRCLVHRLSASIFIYLRNHNEVINPSTSRLNLSFRDPKNLVPDAPIQNKTTFKLSDDLEQMIEKKSFEQYKNKILRGEIDEVKEKVSDPLWGDEDIPTHYFNRLNKKHLMGVSYPQRKDFGDSLTQIYKQYFTSHLQSEITVDLINNSDLHQLVQVALKARNERIRDGSLWFAIQEKLERGKKLYLLNSQELIKLKYAFDGEVKYGTAVFHEILASLLRQDLPAMNKNDLVNLFYACRNANAGITNLQSDVLKRLDTFYSQFSFEQKVNFLFTFTLTTKSLKYYKKVQKRRRYEFKELASKTIFKLDFSNLELNHENVKKLIFSLAKLRLPKTKFISYPLLDYIKLNFDSYTEDANRVMQAIVYLTELESGQGIIDQEFLTKLKQRALLVWDQYNSVQKMRIVYTLWNYGLMNEQVLQLYKQIELQADSTLLYYASQIELHTSSQRQWQVIKLLAYLQFVPLPYYAAYKRFYNYIKATTEWNLQPIHDKLRNTQYYYDVMRRYDAMYEVKSYRNYRQFQQFSQVNFNDLGCPIENLELSHFAYPLHQVSLDIVTPRDYIPGTNLFKESYMNKVRSLKTLGWKHLAFSEAQIKELSLTNFIQNIQVAYVPYVQEQKVIIQYADHLKSQEIQRNKAIKAIHNFTTRTVNKLFFPNSSQFDGQERLVLKDEQAIQEVKQA